MTEFMIARRPLAMAPKGSTSLGFLLRKAALMEKPN